MLPLYLLSEKREPCKSPSRRTGLMVVYMTMWCRRNQLACVYAAMMKLTQDDGINE